MGEPHPVAAEPDVRGNVHFLLARELSELPKPWPRCQDLPQNVFGAPTKDDVVFAVSHAWPYGAHPDPMADKQPRIVKLVEEACMTHKPQGKAVVFCDFLSVSQRPFAPGQADRTPEEEAAFAKALRAFPHIYLQADAVIHVDIPTQHVPGDGELYYVPLTELQGAKVRQLGTAVHVVGWRENGANLVAPFDVVEYVGDWQIQTLADFERATQRANTAASQRAWPWTLSCDCNSGLLVQMRRAPFGLWNSLTADQKGWVYLERFASMVKAAMVHEHQARSVAFATSERLMEEILEGGRRLRQAAGGGRERLEEALQYFVKELEAKKFSAVSLDKVAAACQTDGTQAPPTVNDRPVVVALMRELVEHLAANWEKEERAQRQRQLTLAVSRGDAVACRQLIESGADPNLPDTQGLTCLHAAAKYREHAIIQLLVEMRGDLLCQDLQGNCPAHHLRLYAEECTVPLFKLLAPTVQVLARPNRAGVRPLERLASWAATAQENRPYVPAQEFVKEWYAKHPSLCASRQCSSSKLLPSTGRIAENSIHVCVQGDRVEVLVWGPPDGRADVHVLYLGLALYMPWSMQKLAAKKLADAVCLRCKAKVFVCHHGSLTAKAYGQSLVKFHEYLKVLVDSLPLYSGFYLVDNSAGCATPLLWSIRDRLNGVIVLNPLGWFSDDFYGSEAHKKLLATVHSHAALFKAHNVDGACKLAVGALTFTESRDAIEAAMEAYRGCLEGAPEKFWEYQAQMPDWCITSCTPVMRSLGLLGDVPVVVVCGSHSPALLVQETAARLIGLIQNSALLYIQDSKQWWEAEGENQVAEVMSFLVDLLEHRGDIDWVVN